MAKKVNEKALMNILAEGLLGFYIYQDKCEVSKTLTEHSFHEPVIRIVRELGHKIEAESESSSSKPSVLGDKKRIDFIIRNRNNKPFIGLELKFYKNFKSVKSSLNNDIEKLVDFGDLHNSKIIKFVLIVYKAKEKENIESKKHIYINDNKVIRLSYPCKEEYYKVTAFEVDDYVIENTVNKKR